MNIKMTASRQFSDNGAWKRLSHEANGITYDIDAPQVAPKEEREGKFRLTVTRADGSVEHYWTDTQRHAKAIIAADVEIFS